MSGQVRSGQVISGQGTFGLGEEGDLARAPHSTARHTAQHAIRQFTTGADKDFLARGSRVV